MAEDCTHPSVTAGLQSPPPGYFFTGEAKFTCFECGRTLTVDLATGRIVADGEPLPQDVLRHIRKIVGRP